MILFSKNPNNKFSSHPDAQRLTLCLQDNPRNLDPRKLTDVYSVQIQFMLFEGLLRVNSDNALLPGQAESYEFSDDMRQCTFHLRDSYWSNGDPVTAQDFEYSWKTILGPSFPSPDCYMFFAIQGAEAAKSGKIPTSEIGVFCTDQKTLVVNTNHPCFYLPSLLSAYAFLPVNKFRDQEDPNWAQSGDKLLTNGPFSLVAWEPDQGLLLKKSESYWNKESISVEGISLWIVGDTSFAIRKMYSEGEIDVLGDPICRLPSDIVEEINRRKLEDRVLNMCMTATSFFVALNNQRNPTNNLDVRRALSLAVNRQEIQGLEPVKNRISSSLVPPHLSQAHHPSVLEYNPVEARRLFERGVQELKNNGEVLEDLTITSFRENDTIAESLQNSWSSILGIKIEIKQADFKVRRELQRRGDYHVIYIGNVLTYNDPMSFLERFASKQNYALWNNEEYLKAIEEAKHSTTYSDYSKSIGNAEEVIAREVPLIPILYKTIPVLHPYYVSGFEMNSMCCIDFQKIKVDEKQRRICDAQIRKQSKDEKLDSMQRDYKSIEYRSGINNIKS